ncbi:MAG: Ldh family oxidoreductase [Victivallaceae bacterium]|nr:Ldh family oxidoreductase [Victivallaceae bacterium]
MQERHCDSNLISRILHDIILNAGGNKAAAESVSECLVGASLRGVDSHGIRLFPHYVNALVGGRVNRNPEIKITQVSPAVAILDADDAFGTLACQEAMKTAIKNAKTAGIGVTSVRNSTHFGAAACYGLMAAEADMIGLSFTNASPLMKTENGTRAFFGANPICFTAPMQNESPFCYDASTTQITWNGVKKSRELNESLEAGLAFDKNGTPTIDPFEAVFLSPLGGYKGFGLSIVVDILCGLLAGMPVGDQVTNMYNNDIADKRYLGQFCVAINIALFEDIDNFKKRLQQLADKVRAEPREDASTPIYFPGDPEKILYNERQKAGIPIPDHLVDSINSLCTKYQLTEQL